MSYSSREAQRLARREATLAKREADREKQQAVRAAASLRAPVCPWHPVLDFVSEHIKSENSVLATLSIRQ